MLNDQGTDFPEDVFIEESLLPSCKDGIALIPCDLIETHTLLHEDG